MSSALLRAESDEAAATMLPRTDCGSVGSARNHRKRLTMRCRPSVLLRRNAPSARRASGRQYNCHPDRVLWKFV